MRLHGGTLRIESVAGEDTTVIATLPPERLIRPDNEDDLDAAAGGNDPA